MAATSNVVTTGVEYTQWMDEELIPILTTAFGKDAEYWREAAQRAKKHTQMLPIWEDFDSTVERIRLLLVNRKALTKAEIKDFAWLAKKRGLCVAVFVRHAINHGPYKLASLGELPDRNHVRYKVKKPADEYIYIYGGHLSVDMRLRPSYVEWGHSRDKPKPKPYWPNDHKEEQPYFPEHPKPYWPQDHEDAEEAVQVPEPHASEASKSMPESPAIGSKEYPHPASVEVIESLVQKLEPRKPHWPQDQIESEPVSQALASQSPWKVVSPPDQATVEAVKRKPTPICPAAMRARQSPVQPLGDQKLVHMKHQLPQRPKFSGQGSTLPPRLYHHGRPQVYQGRSGRSLVDLPGRPPYVLTQGGFSSATDQYAFRVAGSQHSYLTPAHMHYTSGQPYPHYAYLTPAIPQVEGSLKTPYAYHSTTLPISPIFLLGQDMQVEAPDLAAQPHAGAQHIRVEANEFVPGAHVHRF